MSNVQIRRLPPESTYNNTSNALGRVAAPLQVLRHNGEDTGRQCHVEQPMCLLAPLLQLLQVLVEALERLVLVVLSGDVGAKLAEVLEHLLHILSRSLDVRLDSAEVLLVVHLGSGISDDLDILGQELVAVLRGLLAHCDLGIASLEGSSHKSEQGRILGEVSHLGQTLESNEQTVFFLAKSPEAPRTTTTVLSFNSIELHRMNGQSRVDARNCQNTSAQSSC